MNNLIDFGPCPGKSDLVYAKCCSALRSGEVIAETARQLMRSRYSAFALGNTGYLVNSWYPDTRPAELTIDANQRWISLKIKCVSHGGADDNIGSVEFIARYKVQGKAHRLQEDSRFRRLDGRWHYLDGERPD
ncbi:MAG: YchJ family protein [Candidatus Azotimanducaceae bacterium WSBS_2022_MAG_OTU7]